MKTDDGCGMMPAILVPTVLSLYSHPSKRAGISARPSLTCESFRSSHRVSLSPVLVDYAMPGPLICSTDCGRRS